MTLTKEKKMKSRSVTFYPSIYKKILLRARQERRNFNNMLDVIIEKGLEAMEK